MGHGHSKNTNSAYSVVDFSPGRQSEQQTLCMVSNATFRHMEYFGVVTEGGNPSLGQLGG